MKPAPQGQMVINMKTTITTHGSHSGFVVHSGILSNNANTPTVAPSSSSNQGSMWSIGPPSRLPIVETPQGTRIVNATSPYPVQMIPSTSQENINRSWSRISNHSPIAVNTNVEKRFEYAPEVSSRSRSHDNLVNERNFSRYESPVRRPPTPPSPVYLFGGRDSPPDEFITPSRVTLNVFEPNSVVPKSYEVGLRRAETASSTDALINDTVMTTTTVEVFRTPIDPSNPSKLVALPPPPVPAIDDRPQLLRLNGPNYERWSSQRTETLINDRPVTSNSSMSQRGVQWKDNLVEATQETERFHQQMDRHDFLNGVRSPFSDAVQPAPLQTSNQTYHVPTVHSIDPRLYSSPIMMLNRSTSPYMVKSPSEASMFSHQIVTSSHEDLRPPSATSYLSAPRVRESPSQLAQIRTTTPSRLTDSATFQSPGPRSPIYVEPIRRTRKELEDDSDRYNSRERDNRSKTGDRDRVERPRELRTSKNSREKHDDRTRRGDFYEQEYKSSETGSTRRHDRSDRDSRSYRDRDHDRQSRRGTSSPRSSHHREQKHSEHGKRRSHSHFKQRDSNREPRSQRHHRSQSPESRRNENILLGDERQSRSRTQVSRTTYDPKSRSISIERDPNYIDGVLQQKNTRDQHATLYQTRDIMDNIVSQFEETDFPLDDGLLLSPLAESEDSLISELSARNDKTKSDYLELRTVAAPRYANIIRETEEVPGTTKFLEKPNADEHVYAEPGRKMASEHIYEELDGYRNISPMLIHPPIDTTENKQKKSKISMELAEFLETEEIFEEVTTTTTTTKNTGLTESPNKNYENSPAMENISKKPVKVLIPPIIIIDKEISVDDSDSSDDSWPEPPAEPSPSESPPPLPSCPPPESPEVSPKLSQISNLANNYTKPITIRKAHPGGLVFPRVTFSLPTLPQLPEDRELSARYCDDSGLSLVPLSNEEAQNVPVKPSPPPASTKPKLVTPNVISQSHKLYISDWETLLNDEFDSDSNTLNEDLSYH